MKIDRTHLDTLLRKGLISDSIHKRLYMADGGMVPASLAPNSEVAPADQLTNALLANATQVPAGQGPAPTPDAQDPMVAPYLLPTTQSNNSAADAPNAAIGVPDSKTSSDGIKLASDLQPPIQSQSSDPMAGLTKQVQNADGAFNLMSDGLKAGAAAAANLGRQEAEYTGAFMKQREADQAQEAVREQARQASLKEAQTKYESMRDDYMNTDVAKPNPMKNFWANASTGQKIVAALSLFLGSNGRDGNGAVKVIQSAIDRDLQQQKMNLDKKQFGLSAQRSLLGDLRAQYGDERQAHNAATAMAWDNAKLELQRLASMSKDPAARANLGVQIGQLELQRQQALGQLVQGAQANATMGALAGGGGVTNPLMLPKEMRELAVKMPDGTFRAASTSEGKKAVDEAVLGGKAVNSIVDEMRKLQGTSLPYTESAVRAKQLGSMLVFALQHNQHLTRLSAEDIKMLEHQFADPTSVRQGLVTKMLDQIQSNVKAGTSDVMSQHLVGGLPPEAKGLDLQPRVK